MAKLARAVIVRDPNRSRDLVFQPGEEPAPEHAVLIKNPACWEGGKLPTAVKRALAAQEDSQDSSGPAQDPTEPAGPTGGQDASSSDSEPASTEDTDTAAPAVAKKTAARKTAASKPARGRDAAEQDTSGE